MMLHAKYQGSMPCGFRFFNAFFLLAYVKYLTPGAEPLWPQGLHFNKLDRGLYGDASY